MNVQESLNNQPEIPESVLAIPSWPARYARFGSFQIDSERGELFRDGQRVKMQAKVYQTLLILVSRAGEIVAREEVGKYLWPERLPMSLDANVNTAMNKLRQALRDSIETPVYVETIPRRGYSFIAPLEFSNLAAPAAPETDKGAKDTAVGGHSETTGRQMRYTFPMVLRIASLVLAGMVVGALLTVAWYSFYNKSHKTLNSTKDIMTRPAAEQPPLSQVNIVRFGFRG